MLPHTDPASSIARRNIAATCTQCHAQIEMVHRKVIKGELWEQEVHVLPACVDCHQPQARGFYDQGMADKDCLRCHARPEIVSSKNGRSLYVAQEQLGTSRHVRTACSQCHAGVNVAKARPCETITQPVDCASCHAEVAQQYTGSMHGQLVERQDPNAPTCKECHGTHAVLGKHHRNQPPSINVPAGARCHRAGQNAVRNTGDQSNIVEHHNERTMAGAHKKRADGHGYAPTAILRTACAAERPQVEHQSGERAGDLRHLPSRH
jgi:hypothetical protein